MNKNEYNNALELFTKGIGVKCDDDQLNTDLYTNRATAHFNLGSKGDTFFIFVIVQ